MNSKSVFSLLLVDFFLILLGNNIFLDGTSFFKSLFIMLIGSGLPSISGVVVRYTSISSANNLVFVHLTFSGMPSIYMQ